MKLNTNLLENDKDLKYPNNNCIITEDKPKLLCYENGNWFLTLPEKTTMKLGSTTEVSPDIIKIDLNTGNIFPITITKNTTIEIENNDLTNFNHGYQAIIRIKNGGNFVVTYPMNFKFVKGKTPVLSKDGYDELNCLILPQNLVFVNVLLDIKGMSEIR